MNNTELKQLCISLAKADKEEEVINLLKNAGYWDESNVWQYYGDNEDNFGTIGNQQSRPDAALIEKIINSVDAMLMRECLRQGITPESENAPKSIEKALKVFFNIFDGKLSNIDARDRTKLAENILLIATGAKSNPSYSIIDKGEGQTPKRTPGTFVSLARSNKLRIPFVQGKFNMGGTGTLQFCGKNNLHLIISKRDPQIAEFEQDETKDYWGFTIIRREDPQKGMRSSTFKYLAPEGNILKFKAENLALLPKEYPKAYGNPLEWGSFIKIYEYQITGLKTLVVFDLYNRLSLLLPNIALPVRIIERRSGYSGHTLEATLSGLSVRLDEDKRDNLEPGFPSSSNMKVMGQEMKILIYVFKRDKRTKYAGDEGIIFTVNGQSHGFLPKSFFARKAVGMSYLTDSMLVIIDCSKFNGRTREDLFMNSRDRLREGDLRNKIENQLEELLKNHDGLRELREKRRREEIEGKLLDSKPLVEVVENIIKKSPALSKLFIEGVRIKNPFKLTGAKEQKEFKSKKFPTYFKIKDMCTKDSPKHCPINKKFRIQFKTDAENEYFTRDSEPGEFLLKINGDFINDYTLNLWNGTANLTVKLPLGVNINNLLFFKCELSDISHVEPFYNEFYVIVNKPEKQVKGKRSERKKPASDKPGKDQERSSYLDLPNIIEIRKDDWERYKFDQNTALSVKDTAENGYDFYINMDNVYLQTEMKGGIKIDPRLLGARFKYGMILIGLSLLQHFEIKDKKEESNEGESVYDKIYSVTKAISPILLPMIASLGDLEIEKDN